MGDQAQLVFDRLIYLRVGVPDAIDDRPARTVDVLFAIGIMDIAALGSGHLRKVAGGMNVLGQCFGRR
jgi:hypothetical protein